MKRYNVYLSFIRGWSGQIFQYAATLLVAKNVSVSDFGLLITLQAAMIVIQVIVESGASEGLIVNGDSKKESVNAAYSVNTVIALVLSVLYVISVTILLDNKKAHDIAIMLALNLIITSIVSVKIAILRLEMRLIDLAISTFTSSAIAFIFFGYMLSDKLGVLALVCYVICQKSLEYFYITWKLGSANPVFSLANAFDAPSVKHGFNTLLSNLANQASRSFPELIISLNLGYNVAAIFSMAMKLLRFTMGMTLSALEFIYLPYISASRSEVSKVLALFYRIKLTSVIVSWTLFATLYIFRNELVDVFLGQQWSELATYMTYFCFLGIVQGASFSFYSVMNGMGASSTYRHINIISMIFNLILVIVGSFLGFEYAIIGFLFRAICFYPIYLYSIHKILNFSVSIMVGILFKGFAFSIIFVGVAYALSTYVASLGIMMQIIFYLLIVGAQLLLFYLWAERHREARL